MFAPHRELITSAANDVRYLSFLMLTHGHHGIAILGDIGTGRESIVDRLEAL